VSCLQAAIMWHQAGAAVVRTATDGTKRPLGEWKAYQRDRPHITEVVDWFSGGHPGIGLITGAVSGVEMLEFEGRAMQTGVDTAFEELCRNSGLDDLWDKLWSGYVEATPSGGLHFIYKTPSPLPNTKLARRPGDPHPEPLIETRGEGGFVVIAPSGGPVHPTGAAWEVLTQCEPHQMVELTAEERDAMFTVARALDEMPPPSAPEPAKDWFFDGASKTEGLTPGDAYEQSHTWEEILVPHGWDRVFKQGHTTHWRRPGKNMGVSATTGKAEDRDRLYVFSTSTPFEAETPVTKFYAYAVLNHGGDCKAAARALSEAGYGDKPAATPAELNRQAITPTAVELSMERKLKVIRGDSVPVRNTYWLWRDRFPLGGISLLAGKGGTSKSTLFAQFSAWLTLGDMKGYFYGSPVNVAYVANEDLIEETIKPRMLAHGADMSRVFFLAVDTPKGEDALRLPYDSQLLTDFINEHGVACTFIDPLSANIDGKVNDPGEMRRTYQAVSKIAQNTRSSIAGLAHTRKQHAEDIVEALMGSVEQSNVARSVHGVVMDPDDDGVRLLSCEKLNLANMEALATLRFELESVPVECTDGSEEINWQPQIKWLEEVSERASHILGNALHGTSGVDEAARWLYDYLVSQGGSAQFQDIVESKPKQMSEDMLRRARKKINVSSRRQRTVPPTSVWSLPS
jgi:hypothetical protein